METTTAEMTGAWQKEVYEVGEQHGFKGLRDYVGGYVVADGGDDEGGFKAA